MSETALKDTLDGSSRHRDPIVVALWALIAAFGTYFCMYMFRKPFTAAVGDRPQVSFGSLAGCRVHRIEIYWH